MIPGINHHEENLWIWNLEDGMTTSLRSVDFISIGGIRSVSLSNDGRTVICATLKSIIVWSYQESISDYVERLEHAAYGINSVSVDSSGYYALCGGSTGTLMIWNLESMTCVKEIHVLSGIDIVGVDLSHAIIESADDKELLRQNGAVV